MIDVVVIGAGAAGLAAARRLREAGVHFQLIEAKSRIGGRAFTDSSTLGFPVDLGCHWLHSPALNPFAQLAEGYGFRCRRGSQSVAVAKDGRLLDAARLADCIARVDACFARIAAGGGRAEDCAVADLFAEPGPWHELFEAMFILKQGLPAASVSARDFAGYVWEGDDWPVLDGLGALVARHGDDLPVSLSTPAERIAWGGKSGVAVETPRGRIEASAAIVTVSTGVLQAARIRFDPPLPGWKQSAIAALPMGSSNKVAIGFERNVFGAVDTMLLTPDLGSHEAIEYVLRPDGRDAVVAFIDGRFGKAVASQGPRAMADYALGRLAEIFGAELPRHAREPLLAVNWDEDPDIRGCYAAAIPGAAESRKILAEPVEGRLFFAGEATSVPYAGDVHGAHFSGIAAAETAIEALRW